jgi:hypothetical protein
MKREQFLAHVGDPAASRISADDLDEKALALWRSVKHAYFTAAGKPKKEPAGCSVEAQIKAICDNLRAEAAALRRRAAEQERAHSDPASHLNEWTLRREGLDSVADRVAAAYARFLAEAEAA